MFIIYICTVKFTLLIYQNNFLCLLISVLILYVDNAYIFCIFCLLQYWIPLVSLVLVSSMGTSDGWEVMKNANKL